MFGLHLHFGWHGYPMFVHAQAHYKEAECMRQAIEPLLYEYGVDIMFAGCAHCLYTQQLETAAGSGFYLTTCILPCAVKHSQARRNKQSWHQSIM